MHQQWHYHGNRLFRAMLFKVCNFCYKKKFIYFTLLNYYVRLTLVLSHQTYDNCECKTGFLKEKWRKKENLKWTNGWWWVQFSTVFISLASLFTLYVVNDIIMTSLLFWKIINVFANFLILSDTLIFLSFFFFGFTATGNLNFANKFNNITSGCWKWWED